MQEFSIDVDSKIKGIYLNSETIELLSIMQCKDTKELKEFALKCSQLNISEQEIDSWKDEEIKSIKEDLVKQYKDTLKSLEESTKDKRSVLKATLIHSGIKEDEVDSYISTFEKDGYEGVKQKLKTEHPDKYDEYATKAHEFIASERDQMKSVTYEELSDLNDRLSNHNTILLGAGRYYDVTKKMYDDQIPDMEKYDFYYAERGLDFCCRNGMYARYHTLLDKQTMEKHLIGKPKEEVLKELQAYVKKFIDFITEYNENENHKIDGKGVIVSVDLCNEMISFDEPYINKWQELYGITNEDLFGNAEKGIKGVFQYALDNKPEGVTYVYNEPFLENKERREAVIKQLTQMKKLSPELIDTIGTQMHIDMTQNIEDIKECFEDLKKLEEMGIKTQITEFDMCLPERFMFDENGHARSEKELVELANSKFGVEIQSIAEFKKMRIDEISQAIKETGIELEGITYWSSTDTLDHNLQRSNEKTYEEGLDRDIAQTRYAGLYSGLGEREKEKTITETDIGKTTINTDTQSKDMAKTKMQRDLQKMQEIAKNR